MIDVNSTTATRPAGAVQTRPATAPAAGAGADGSGKNQPADGRTLPVDTARPVEVKEFPDLQRLAENLADFARQLNRDLSFSIHEASGRTVVMVLDGETKEVIRQIPSEEALRMSEALAESRGVLLDRKA